MGLVGYYGRFIQNFAALAEPLCQMTTKKAPEEVEWTPNAELAFESLKEALFSAPVLTNPNYTEPFILQTDASGKGLGAVLTQRTDGEEHPIGFISRKLTPAESRYSTIEKEALAIKWAISKFHYFLAGRHFFVETDHDPLRWLHVMSNQNEKLARWILALQAYDFTISSRPGVANANADALSRYQE